ncbi:MAG: response regulator [Deltaproteobacteria bacterium]|nr:response regulator [Deltaproteobacteria bacterium]
MARILVVDDEPQVRQLLRGTLLKAGYEVDEAEDGDMAIERYRDNPADLVISDIVMPERDGTGLIIALQQEFPDLKIIAMSGGGVLDPQYHLCLAKAFGAIRTFPKPVPLHDLLEAVQELLAES